MKKSPPLPAPDTRQWFRRRLLAWYRANGRDLPWRHTRDPYHILVSESKRSTNTVLDGPVDGSVAVG